MILYCYLRRGEERIEERLVIFAIHNITAKNIVSKVKLNGMQSKYDDGKSNFLSPNVTQYDGHMVMTNVMKPTKRNVNSLCPTELQT